MNATGASKAALRAMRRRASSTGPPATRISTTAITAAGVRDAGEAALVVWYCALATVLVWGPVIVYVTLTVPEVIMTESFLSFLGLGVQPPTPSLGEMISAARAPAVLQNQPWVWIPAGVVIALGLAGCMSGQARGTDTAGNTAGRTAGGGARADHAAGPAAPGDVR